MRFWNWSIWRWPHWRIALEVFERLVVIVGVGLAVFPLWQWHSEKDDRRIERIVELITAGEFCKEYVTRELEVPTLDSVAEAYDSSTEWILYKGLLPRETLEFNLSIVCLELATRLTSDPNVEAQKESLETIGDTK